MPRGRPRKYPVAPDGLGFQPVPLNVHDKVRLLEIQNQELFGAFNEMVDKFNAVMTVVERRLQLLEAGVARPSLEGVSAPVTRIEGHLNG